MKFFRKYHKWLGIIFALVIVLFALSGIVLNHRPAFSKYQIQRSKLAESYNYSNWNNASVKGSLKVNTDSILVYGNVGVWLTDSTFSTFSDFNQGFKKGIDNRKIHKLFRNNKGELYAGTLFGLYFHNNSVWQKVPIDKHIQVVDITQKQDTLIVLSRSHLYKSVDLIHFEKIQLPSPVGYDNKVGLFKTLWVIHSGELFGYIGKLFVDFMGLIFIFLSITGVIYFIAPTLMKRKRKRKLSVLKIAKVNRFSLKWHNKLGVYLIGFLIITTITGMFLRPPLLIAIAGARVKKIPLTTLNSSNAWFDKLRRIIYDEDRAQYIVATNEEVYFIDENLQQLTQPSNARLPISVMGVNVFEQVNSDLLLIGSFEGLFAWSMSSGKVYDYIEQREYIPVKRKGKPIGKYMAAGYTRDFMHGELLFDYNTGVRNLSGIGLQPKMPELLVNQPMSLWNFALEVHTGRIYQSLLGIFYILVVPLSGLVVLFILISGFLVYWRYHKR